MNVTEAPPDTLADGVEQDPGGFYAADWAARGDLSEAVAAALPEAMRSRLAANVELARRAVLAEEERDAALADNRLLRERVSRQRQTIESLRRRETLGRTGRLLERMAAIATPGGTVGIAEAPCACLERPAAGEPVRGRWIPWVRPR